MDPPGAPWVRAAADVGPVGDWTSERLAELRGSGYRARAWLDFVRLSLERSAEHRRRRPQADRQLRRWVAAWAAAALAAARAPRTPRVPLRAEARWLATTWLMIRWHLGMLDGDAGGARERLSRADAVTLTRLWLAPRVRRAGADRAALTAMLVLGAATDVLDGRLARQHGASRLGRDLDSLTDLAFFRAAGRAARDGGAIGRLPAAAFELRLAVAPAYATWHYFRFTRPAPVPPRAPVRAATAVALAGIATGAGGRDGDVAVLWGSAAAVAIQLASAIRALHDGRARPDMLATRQTAPTPGEPGAGARWSEG